MAFAAFMTSALKLLGALGIIFGPLVGYIGQLIKMQNSQKSEGFSIRVCIILITANILRIFFWYCGIATRFEKRFDNSIVLASIVMIIFQVTSININRLFCCALQLSTVQQI
eukprot:TRINITY_DN10280_c0_g3_i1.p1 TRINITY_DN10280_c0_g3~~TRINITY_DN10280_c0_g3_i1.p1  ORF type:complete len:112 (+),score=3.98 TRINITY_DN10280_c0_g3_i1:92-427(+)